MFLSAGDAVHNSPCFLCIYKNIVLLNLIEKLITDLYQRSAILEGSYTAWKCEEVEKKRCREFIRTEKERDRKNQKSQYVISKCCLSEKEKLSSCLIKNRSMKMSEETEMWFQNS
jgi:hypothetical protein